MKLLQNRICSIITFKVDTVWWEGETTLATGQKNSIWLTYHAVSRFRCSQISVVMTAHLKNKDK